MLFKLSPYIFSFLQSLSIQTVKLCLKTLGFAYTEESVVRSELRVLSMIGWQPPYHCTPLVYIESLFKILSKFGIRNF